MEIMDTYVAICKLTQKSRESIGVIVSSEAKTPEKSKSNFSYLKNVRKFEPMKVFEK